jgi:hypothetical protein
MQFDSSLTLTSGIPALAERLLPKLRTFRQLLVAYWTQSK